MLLLYKLDDFNNTTEFLCKLAIAKGKIKKVTKYIYDLK